MMELRLEISGEVVERQELLNGTQTLTIEGADDTGEWTLSGSISWNMGLVDYAGEGDVALSGIGGAEMFGTVTRAEVADAADQADDADHLFRLTYEIDGGAGPFEGAAGAAAAEGAIAGDRFRGVWTLRLTEA